MKRSRRKPLSPEEREQAQEFHRATWQQPCASCDRPWSLTADAHHVVEKQELKDRKLPLWDTRNALALCADCHERHTNASKRIPFRKLRPENVAYAYEVLGDYAGDYLKRRYPLTEEKGT